MLEYFLCLCVLLALVNTGVWYLFGKLGLTTWMQFRVSEWVWPSRCQFCFFYRLSLIETVYAELFHRVGGDVVFVCVFLPLGCAALSLWFLGGPRDGRI